MSFESALSMARSRIEKPKHELEKQQIEIQAKEVESKISELNRQILTEQEKRGLERWFSPLDHLEYQKQDSERRRDNLRSINADKQKPQ